MRYLGLDVHRDFCEVAIRERGRARSAGRIDTTREALELFASSLAPDDRVVLESTGNALAIANILRGRVAEVVLANPMQVRAISHAKVKNDRVDARTLAELLAADLLPQVWIADDSTRALRRLTSRRTQLVRQRTRTKNEVSAVLIRNLIARPKVSDLFGRAGRQFMATLVLPADERHTLDGCLRQVDFLGEELAVIDRAIAEQVLASDDMRRLITIPGVDATTAATMMATIGRIQRFPTPRQLVGYVGLDARVRQSGTAPPGTGGSPSKAPPPPITCSFRPPGPRSRRPGRCTPSTGASRPAAAPRSRSSPSPASSRSSPGTCSPSNRTTTTNARCSSPASSAGSSSKPAPHHAPATAPRARTPIHRTCNARASPKLATRISPATGRRDRPGLDFHA
jgi:transposase